MPISIWAGGEGICMKGHQSWLFPPSILYWWRMVQPGSDLCLKVDQDWDLQNGEQEMEILRLEVNEVSTIWAMPSNLLGGEEKKGPQVRIEEGNSQIKYPNRRLERMKRKQCCRFTPATLSSRIFDYLMDWMYAHTQEHHNQGAAHLIYPHPTVTLFFISSFSFHMAQIKDVEKPRQPCPHLTTKVLLYVMWLFSDYHPHGGILSKKSLSKIMASGWPTIFLSEAGKKLHSSFFKKQLWVWKKSSTSQRQLNRKDDLKFPSFHIYKSHIGSSSRMCCPRLRKTSSAVEYRSSAQSIITHSLAHLQTASPWVTGSIRWCW